MRTIFRIGPVLVLIPTIAWAEVWHVVLRDESENWLILGPPVGLLAIVVMWHVALLIIEQDKLAYFAYAIAFIPTFLTALIFATMFAVSFPV
jgi:hypothetical protein